MAKKTATKKAVKKASKPASKSPFGAPHTGHEHHMCELVRKRDLASAAKYTKGANYICRICGRGAAKSMNLCEPVEI